MELFQKILKTEYYNVTITYENNIKITIFKDKTTYFVNGNINAVLKNYIPFDKILEDMIIDNGIELSKAMVETGSNDFNSKVYKIKDYNFSQV